MIEMGDYGPVRVVSVQRVVGLLRRRLDRKDRHLYFGIPASPEEILRRCDRQQRV
jgi:hypothetical protein